MWPGLVTLQQEQADRRTKESESLWSGGEEQAKILTVAINSHKQDHLVNRFPGTGPPANELSPKACEATRATQQKFIGSKTIKQEQNEN